MIFVRYKRYDRLVDTSVKNQLFSDLYKFEQLELMDELFSPTKIPVKTKTANFDFHAWSLGVSVAALRHYLPMERGARDITVVVGRGTHSDHKTALKGFLGPRLIKALSQFDPPIEARNLQFFIIVKRVFKTCFLRFPTTEQRFS